MPSTNLARREKISAQSALAESPVQVLRTVSVTETAESIVLSGTVPSFYFKQMAQEKLRGILGGRRLYNRLRVIPHKR